jgi:PHP family Zn ribbon phosphoesterase
MIQYNKCPKCGKTIKAHQGNRKTFRELTKVEQDRSVRAMTINLRRAIKAMVGINQQELNRKLLQTIRVLVKL